jgi:hypothetical protein
MCFLLLSQQHVSRLHVPVLRCQVALCGHQPGRRPCTTRHTSPVCAASWPLCLVTFLNCTTPCAALRHSTWYFFTRLYALKIYALDLIRAWSTILYCAMRCGHGRDWPAIKLPSALLSLVRYEGVHTNKWGVDLDRSRLQLLRHSHVSINRHCAVISAVTAKHLRCIWSLS